MENWYYAKQNQQHGPVREDELISLLKEGEIRMSDLVWTEGMEQWKPARSVQDLFSTLMGASATSAKAAGTSVPPETTGPASISQDSAVEDRFTASGPSRKYAGFWKRFTAYIIDFILTVVVSFIGGFVLGLSLALAGFDQGAIMVFAYLLGIVGGWIYYAAFESSKYQATPGKMALGIKVTDKAGHRVGFGKATGRHFGKIISGLILCIGFLMAAFTEKKQALHDIMAGCLVVNK